jgi:2-octaprenyl-6-methoxyphenol hydroxylase
MKNQKICIIGDGLAGLSTALTLKDLNIEVDLLYKKNILDKKDNRTTAISESNFQFLNKILKIKNKKYFWSCKEINLYYENEKKIIKNFLNFSEGQQKLMHILKNNNFKKLLINKINKEKKINFIKTNSINVDSEKSFVKYNNKKTNYDLIILCVGKKSELYNNLGIKRSITKDYKEVAITGTVSHKRKNINPSQYFLREGPLAILPFEKKKFSFVWSLNKQYYQNNKGIIKELLNNKIKKISKVKFKYEISKINTFPIHLDLRSKYYKKNILILGEGLHSIHPIAGQGFNLVIRDIIKLFFLIKKNIKLGLLIKDSNILKEFYESRKPENTLLGIAIDFTNLFFKEKKFLDPLKNILIDNVKRNTPLKNFAKYVSDKGFSI